MAVLLFPPSASANASPPSALRSTVVWLETVPPLTATLAAWTHPVAPAGAAALAAPISSIATGTTRSPASSVGRA